jgi:small subunit ribosomal protein S16
MAVHIRLARAGTKKTPFYRIVVADQRSPRGGRFIERIGTYDPRRPEFHVDAARVQHWLSKGAQPSATVAMLLRQPNALEPVGAAAVAVAVNTGAK